MIKHIVLWTLVDTPNTSKKQNAETAKRKLEALKASIPELIEIEVGIDLIGNGSSADMCLYSVFQDEAALKRYQGHPEHQKILPFIASITSNRQVIDYAI